MLAVTLSWVVTALGVLVFLLAVVRGAGRAGAEARTLAAATALTLEFFLAAGLLRLGRNASFGVLAAVAAIVLLRRVLGFGVRYAVRAVDG